jgi:predicted DNA-binding protein
MKLTINIPYTLYNRLCELRDVYEYETDDEALAACISSAYMDYILKGDNKVKACSFYLPVAFVDTPSRGQFGLVDRLANETYRKTGGYIRETIDKTIEQKEKIALLLSVCPNGFYENAKKKNFAVNLDPSTHTLFRDVSRELRVNMSKVLTGLLYYRLKQRYNWPDDFIPQNNENTNH